MDMPLPPLFKDQRPEDRKHLKWLSIAHYGFAGTLAVGIVFLYLHYWVFSHFLCMPRLFANGCGRTPPLDFCYAIHGFYWVVGTVLSLGVLANVASGWFVARHKYRTFTLAINVLNFFQMPFGTALAVFTYLVLVRDSVVELYHPDLGGGPTRA